MLAHTLKRKRFRKIVIAILVSVLIIIFCFFGYRLSYKKDIEKIDLEEQLN